MVKFTEIKKEINKKIKVKAVTSFLDYYKKLNLNFWGEEKDKNKSFYITLYKDTRGVGYDKVLGDVKKFYKVGKKTLQNINLVRNALSDWSDTQINIGNLDEWKQASKNLGTKGEFKSVNL